jgi:hypothetical protein
MGSNRSKPITLDKLPENIEFAAQELLEVPADDRHAMLEGTGKTLTRRLVKDNPGIGIREVSGRVTRFLNAVRQHLEDADRRAAGSDWTDPLRLATVSSRGTGRSRPAPRVSIVEISAVLTIYVCSARARPLRRHSATYITPGARSGRGESLITRAFDLDQFLIRIDASVME